MIKSKVLSTDRNSADFFLSLIKRLPVEPIGGDFGLHAEIDLPHDLQRPLEVRQYIEGCFSQEIIPCSSITVIFDGKRFVPERWNSDLLEMLPHADERVRTRAYQSLMQQGKIYEIRIPGADLELFSDLELGRWLEKGYHVGRANLVLHKNGAKETSLRLGRFGAELTLERGPDTQTLQRYFTRVQEEFKYAKPA